MIEKIDKAELAQKINALELDNETKSQLLELLHERKRYGLVWEDKPEAAEERLQSELPILREVKERAIISDEPAAPNHILIEGDNFEALTTLSYTHEGKIDVIYIDPPYNTGNKDFVYNDSYVDTEDQFRHSKWLSFMAKRLKIAKRLLSDKGVIFISIDDNEQAQLKLLCDEVFGERNLICPYIWQKKTSGGQGARFALDFHEYVLCYARVIENLDSFLVPRTDEQKKSFKLTDEYVQERGHYLLSPLQSWLDYRANLIYPIEMPDGTIIDGVQWTHGKESFEELKKDGRIEFKKTKNGWTVYKKQYENDKKDGVIPPSIITVAQSSHGTKELKELFGDQKPFSNPKPTKLVSMLIGMTKTTDSTILDFFAGSGTTLHATMQLNAEDGGHRQCILVTNNENNICEEVTYERNKRVINGYTTPKGEQVEGLHANTLRYYKTDFVARENSATAKRELMYAATDMLCIKNNIYTEQAQFGSRKFRKDVCRYFADGERGMLAIYNPDAIEAIVEEIMEMEVRTPIVVYVFSLNDYAMDADFEDVSEKVSLCALPAAILNAYRKVLPKKQQPKAKEEVQTYSGELNFEEETL